MRITKHKKSPQRQLWVKFILLASLSFVHFNFTPPPLVSPIKTDFSGIWSGMASVDFGEGYKEEFEYELLLRQEGKKIVGYSTTILEISTQPLGSLSS